MSTFLYRGGVIEDRGVVIEDRGDVIEDTT
jgi:hypothetical protein